MKACKFILSYFFVCMAFSLFAQSESKIWIDGYVFSETAETQKGVPFAVISFFDTATHDNLAYFTVCGPFGNYRIKPYDYTREYHAVVECPGYETRMFRIKPVPETWSDGRPFIGNATVNIRLNPMPASKDIVPEKFVNEDKSVRNLLQFLQTLPDIVYEDGNLFTRREGNVCLLMNGYYMNGSGLIQQLEQIPANAVSCIEYYTLPEEGIYQAAVNVVLSIGTQASWPEYKKKDAALIE